MQQLSLDLNLKNSVIKEFIISTTCHNLSVNNFDFSNPTHLSKLFLQIKNLSDIDTYSYSFNHKKLLQTQELISLFENELNKESILKFYYQTFLAGSCFTNQYSMSLFNECYQYVEPKILFEKFIQIYGISDVSTTSIEKNLFSNTEYTKANQLEKISIKKFHNNYFKDFLNNDDYINKLNNRTFNRLINFLINDLNNDEPIFNKDEFLNFFDTHIDIILKTLKDYSLIYEKKKLLLNIFQNQKISIKEKENCFKQLNESTDTLMLDKQVIYSAFNFQFHNYEFIDLLLKKLNNHFSNDPTPIYSNKLSFIKQLTNCTHLTNGIPIKLSIFFLDLLEKNFENGKKTLDFFIPDIKHVFNDPKISHLNGIDFLMAYCEKKQKTSITIANKYKNINDIKIKFEKENLLKQLEFNFDNQTINKTTKSITNKI